jgi:hypothetical protein
MHRITRLSTQRFTGLAKPNPLGKRPKKHVFKPRKPARLHLALPRTYRPSLEHPFTPEALWHHKRVWVGALNHVLDTFCTYVRTSQSHSLHALRAVDVFQTLQRTFRHRLMLFRKDVYAHPSTHLLPAQVAWMLGGSALHPHAHLHLNHLFEEVYRTCIQVACMLGLEHTYTRAFIRKHLQQALTVLLNQSHLQKWGKIQGVLHAPHTGAVGVSNIVPINKAWHPTFAHHGHTGVSSYSHTSSRPVNFAYTECVSSTGLTLFGALRGGVACAFGISDTHARALANQQRVHEILTAATVHFLNNVSLEEQKMLLSAGTPFTVPVCAMSLLTPTGSQELWVKEHFQTFEMHDMHTQPKPFEISVKWNGVSYTLPVHFNILGFNMGVNENALCKNLGWDETLPRNTVAFERLSERVRCFLETQPEHPHHKDVALLWPDIQHLWNTQAYRTEGIHPFKWQARVCLLCHWMGTVVYMSCKSGKDRTGLMDVETKWLALLHHHHKHVPPWDRESTPEEYALLKTLLLNGGNATLQRYNNGAPGFRLSGTRLASLIKRLETLNILQEVEGLAPFIDNGLLDGE